MSDRVYCYPPDYRVLRNKLGLRNGAELERAERQLVVQRTAEGVPPGDFDLAHLKAIHHHLFQDVYDRAGQIRTVEIAKDGLQFQFCRYIETGMTNVHRRIVDRHSFIGSTAEAFATEAGEILGDVNYVHPFREGNGRAQLLYLKLLAERAGHQLDLGRLEPVQWVDASRAAHQGDYLPLALAIRRALVD